jgi:Big-like domain-containing protein
VDGDALTVTVVSCEVGTATVNADRTIAISGLPAGFRGVTRFRYRAADPSATSSISTAVVFIDVAPFRVIFPADEPGQDSPEVFITNLASAPVQISQATEGTLRLRSMIAAANGSMVAYRRHDQAQGNAPVDLSFVRTADPATQVRIQLPAGMTQQPVVSGDQDSYVVSPNGQWIAGIASKPGAAAVFLVNIADPTNVHTATPADTTVVQNQSLQFSSDSQHLYFVAGVTSDNNVFSLYRTAMAAPTQSQRMSALRTAPGGMPADTVMSYSVSSDQSKIVLQAGINAVSNLYYVSGASPGTEIQLTPQLDSLAEIVSSVARFGNVNRVAYTVQAPVGPTGEFVAEISATPNPRPLFGAPGGVAEAIRPDGQAVLLSGFSAPGLLEVLVDSGQPPTVVDSAQLPFNVHYDERGDAVMAQVFHDTPSGAVYVTIGTAGRPTFGTLQQVGTPDLAALITVLSATDRAIVVVGEGPKVQPVPPVQSVRLALANAWAPDKLLYVTDLLTSRNQKGSRAALVDP